MTSCIALVDNILLDVLEGCIQGSCCIILVALLDYHSLWFMLGSSSV